MTNQKNIVIGTSGHVDHGKTTLVKALTGVDADRLLEEKNRGITIDLGFAQLILPGGLSTALIDVPGHERFIKNMLAGAAGIDLALLIIAADEGVMPQTREHLDIMRLLEIKDLIVVITKIDLADTDILDLVEDETRDLLRETPYNEAPVVKVSASTGQGIDRLLQVIEERVEMLHPRGAENTFSRLPIDRVFSVQGFGTVATGTLFNGEINVGDILEAPARGIRGRVRNLQIHGAQVSSVCAGQRVAINLAGLDRNDLKRGDVLASPGVLSATERIDVSCHLLKTSPELKTQTRVRFFQGTRETLGRITFFDRASLKPGEEAFMQIALEEPIIVVRGDTYIIRSYSPLYTIGGGRIIEPHAQKHRKKDTGLMEELVIKAEGNKTKLAYQYLVKAQRIVLTEQVSVYLGVDQITAEKILNELKAEDKLIAFEFSDQETGFIAVSVLETWIKIISREIQTFLKDAPLSQGLDKEVLRGQAFPKLTDREYGALLTFLAKNRDVQIIEGHFLQPWGYQRNEKSGIYLKAEEAGSIYDSSGWQVPSWDTVKEQIKVDEKSGRQILQYLIRNERLIQLDNNLYVSIKAAEEGKRRLEEWLQEQGELTVAQARDVLGSSRKTTVPFLEYLDGKKVTARVGDKRVLFNKANVR